jgi:hypothetical protein
LGQEDAQGGATTETRAPATRAGTTANASIPPSPGHPVHSSQCNAKTAHAKVGCARTRRAQENATTAIHAPRQIGAAMDTVRAIQLINSLSSDVSPSAQTAQVDVTRESACSQKEHFARATRISAPKVSARRTARASALWSGSTDRAMTATFAP